MLLPAEIKDALRKLTAAAKYADKTGDKESYEVLANCAVALDWVCTPHGSPRNQCFEELLKGAAWAATGGTERN
jgi:hypothetical protein